MEGVKIKIKSGQNRVFKVLVHCCDSVGGSG